MTRDYLQIDIRGNPFGLLSAHPLAPLVSLHHLDYVQSIFPGMTQIDSLKKLAIPYKADPGRTLQHCFCYDLSRSWSASVSWGYSIQLYPSLVTAKQLETAFSTFRTWRTWNNGPFTFNTRLMADDPCERPVIYFLDRVESLGAGKTLTRYKRYVLEDKDVKMDCEKPEYAPILAVQYVNVTTSTLDPNIWNMVS